LITAQKNLIFARNAVRKWTGDRMDDLISRQAAIDALDKRFDNIPMEQTTEILQLRRDLRQLPSAQPKRGKWIHHPEIGWGETWLCDQCGEKTTSTVMGKPRANFCPNCGADMRGEQDG
jgi:rubrerythrin